VASCSKKGIHNAYRQSTRARGTPGLGRVLVYQASTTLIWSNRDGARGRRAPVTSISTHKKVYHWRNQEKEKLEAKADQEEHTATVSGTGQRPEQSIMTVRRGSGEIQI
jgi:hypothetical protein